MIVHRSVWNVKLGRAREATELVKRAKKQLSIPYRALYNAVGTGLRVAIEVEFENYAELEKGVPEFQRKFLEALGASGEKDPRAQLSDVLESWHCREVWHVIE